MKNIGILTHHFASNFGANLQTLSTFEHLKKKGFNPVVIDWRSSSLEANFNSSVPVEQIKEHDSFVKQYLQLTGTCRTPTEMAAEIERNKIEAIVIGSDAVVQHWPLLSRIAFPTRKVISIYHFSSDRMYPNQFWGDFIPYLSHPVKLIYMSVSSQNSPYKFIGGKTKREMSETIGRFDYISVRDSWTKKMFQYLNPGIKEIPITPDPVFSFNTNAGHLLPEKDEIMMKYGLSGKYMLLCFFKKDDISDEWIDSFVSMAENKGYECYSFPLPSGALVHPKLKKIKFPLSPLDWYSIIKYSSGFVGRNMHPIVISLHNEVPCFSFDQYGTKRLNMFVNEKSSKIYHILEKAGLLENRTTFQQPFPKTPKPELVLDKLINYNKKQYHQFSLIQQKEYDMMMDEICNIIAR